MCLDWVGASKKSNGFPFISKATIAVRSSGCGYQLLFDGQPNREGGGTCKMTQQTTKLLSSTLPYLPLSSMQTTTWRATAAKKLANIQAMGKMIWRNGTRVSVTVPWNQAKAFQGRRQALPQLASLATENGLRTHKQVVGTKQMVISSGESTSDSGAMSVPHLHTRHSSGISPQDAHVQQVHLGIHH